jgi:hypothetical protein
MDDTRALLLHLLATIAFRARYALRGAPESFGSFQAGNEVWTPAELVRHMTSVLGYVRSCFEGTERPRIDPLPDLAAEITRFHAMIEDVARHVRVGAEPKGMSEEQILQGPFADALTHVGQLAMLRRLSGCPVQRESFIQAHVDPADLGPDQTGRQPCEE